MNPASKDFSPDPVALHDALARLIAAKNRPGTPHVASAEAGQQLAQILPLSLPTQGIGGAAALDLLAPLATGGVPRLDHPGFLAHMDPPTPWVTWAASLWAAAMNQNLLHPDTGAPARALETRVIDWLAPRFGMTGGQLLPGSTLANLTALWAARDLGGARRVIASSAAHVSVGKAARVLGLPIEWIAPDADQCLRARHLSADLSDAALVLTAGTTASGAIDELHAGRNAAWRHVDAAWAGPLRLTRHAALLDGIETANSVALSAHKWLYQPKESAMVLFADAPAAAKALSFGSSYLTVPNVGLLGSHGAAALPLAATLLAWGEQGLAARIEAGMACAARLADRVEADDRLELWARPTTGVVLWRPRAGDPARVQAHLHDAWVSLATVDGQSWFRSVAANPQADPDHVVDAVLAAISAARYADAPANETPPFPAKPV